LPLKPSRKLTPVKAKPEASLGKGEVNNCFIKIVSRELKYPLGGENQLSAWIRKEILP
jgi:hypothetical protein